MNFDHKNSLVSSNDLSELEINSDISDDSISQESSNLQLRFHQELLEEAICHKKNLKNVSDINNDNGPNYTTSSNESTQSNDINNTNISNDSEYINDISISCEENNDCLTELRQVNTRNDTCPICLESEGIINDLCTCSSYYHKECWEKWVQNNNTCPTCRKKYNESPIYGPIPNISISINNNIGPRRASNILIVNSGRNNVTEWYLTFFSYLTVAWLLYFFVVLWGN